MADDSINTIGRYEIEREIGHGGMAVVYRAHDPQLDRVVAVKLIRKGAFPPEQLAPIMERFKREAKALARLNHPNIVKVLDYGEHEGAPYLVMEYIEGATLKDVKKPLRVETAVQLIRPIAEALDYVHSQGLLHRDVKPSNIMITKDERVILTDFGIAKWLEDDTDQATLTGTGIGIGTPEYMAPEQARGLSVDGRTDAYSLTVVFFELITGEKPYRGDTAIDILVKQASEPIPDPREFVPELNESVKRFLDRAMAKKPDGRYPAMKDYLRDLDGLRLQSMTTSTLKAKPSQMLSENTEIQAVPKSGTTTDSSVRFARTDIRKVREAAEAAEGSQPKQPSGKNPNFRMWLVPVLGILAIFAVWFGIQRQAGTPPINPTVTAAEIEPSEPQPQTSIPTIVTETDVPTLPVQAVENVNETLTALKTESPADKMAATATTKANANATPQVTLSDQQIIETATRQTTTAEEKKAVVYGTLTMLDQRLTETEIASRGSDQSLSTPVPTERPDTTATQAAQTTRIAQERTSTAAKQNLEETAIAIHQKETELAVIVAEMTLTANAALIQRAAAETEQADIAAAQIPMAATVTETAAQQEIPATITAAPTVYAPYANLKAGDIIEFGRYEQDNNLSNGTEAIEWLVLDVSNGIAMLTSVYGLDTKPFNNRYVWTTWEGSWLRQWLNSEFFESAFDSAERKLISVKTLVNDKNDSYGTSGGNPTNDSVYLLSTNEAKKYLKNGSVEVTEYAKTNGASADSNGFGQWWLRSPGFDGARFTVGTTDGSYDLYGNVLNQTNTVIRPVINLNMDYKRLNAKTDNLSQIHVGDDVILGQYEQDNNLANGEEPILWQVLDVLNDSAILISHSILDSKRYNNEWAFVSWDTCSLRKWLNSEFYESAFDPDEQSIIEQSVLSTGNNPTYGTYGGAETEDKVYVLSAKETESYVDTNYFSTAAEATKYAIAQGFIASWWQRSPGRSGRYVTTPDYWEREVSRDGLGVRPVIKIRTDLRISE